jgi:hypothetical protein
MLFGAFNQIERRQITGKSIKSTSGKGQATNKNSAQLGESADFTTNPFVFRRKSTALHNQSYKIGGKGPPPDTLANASLILSLPEII